MILTRAEQIRLVKQYTPLVVTIAGGFMRVVPRNVLRDDLIGSGMLGLWDAIKRNPPGAIGTDNFDWYVRVRIRGAILDGMRDQDWLPRRARAAASETVGTEAYAPPPAIVRFDELSESEQNRLGYDGAMSECEADVHAVSQRESLILAIGDLQPRLRGIMLGILKGETLKSIAKRLGVTEPRVSQLKLKSIEFIRDSHHMKNGELR